MKKQKKNTTNAKKTKQCGTQNEICTSKIGVRLNPMAGIKVDCSE